jgi:hypothetical protein
MSDHPFYEVAAAAKKWIDAGQTIHQKFTCENCGVRQTMEIPNVFYTSGKCEECGHVTDLKLRGCNYLLYAAIRRK